MLGPVSGLRETTPAIGSDCLSGSPSIEVAAFRGALRQVMAPSTPPPQQRSVLDPVADQMLQLDAQVAHIVAAPPRPSESMIVAPDPEPTVTAPAAPAAGPVLALMQPPPLEPPPATGTLRDLPAPESLREDFAGLGLGDKSADVSRVQRVLKKWNPRLDVQVTGKYDESTRRALTLYKAIYGTGRDGRSIDPQTSSNLARMEDGTFWNSPPEKSMAGKILYAASQDLGKPYRMGGNGKNSTDCAMLTREALRSAGAVGDDFTRLADLQLQHAERGQGLTRIQGEPEAGDLVFFNNPTWQSSIAYKGVTHVGLYVGDGMMLAASSGQGKVVLQPIAGMSRHMAGVARAK